MSDKQAQQDALRAQRAYEAYEREWRRKEKDAAEKQAAQERDLREERIKQQKAREYAIAVEAHKMRQEFYENLQRQKALEQRLKTEEVEIAERNKKYAQEVKVLFWGFESSNIRLKFETRKDFVAKTAKNSSWKVSDLPNNALNKRQRLITLRIVKSRYFVSRASFL